MSIDEYQQVQEWHDNITSTPEQWTTSSDSLNHVIIEEGNINESFNQNMQQSYGFSPSECQLLKTAFTLLLKEARRKELDRQQEIHFVFSNLAALCNSYDGGDGFRWKASGNIPATNDFLEYLKSNGMGNDVDILYNAINEQHYTTKERGVQKDFAHELVQYAIFSDDSFLHQILDGTIGRLDALGSYKGDVFSGRMGIDDINSDIDATNIYQRMLSSDKNLLDIIARYNTDVYHDELNRVDEFLKYYGNSDINKGLEYIKNDLNNVDIGAHYIGGTYDGLLEFAWENIQDALFSNALMQSQAILQGEEVLFNSLKRNNANQVFKESTERKKSGKDTTTIEETRNNFIKYLEEGMSK